MSEVVSSTQCPKEVWVVIDNIGQPDFVASHSVMAHDHVNDYGSEEVSVEGWVVRKYIIAEKAEEWARLLTYAITHSNGRHLFSDGFMADAKEALGL